ncbi:alpha/beta fold hydrolase [Bacteroidota bacterium]
MKKLLKAILFVIVLLLSLFILFYLLTWGDYEVAKTVEQDPDIPHIEIGGVVFHAETFGSDTNDVVIVLHGGPGNDFRYLLELKELANEYFVVFYDQRGTGLSPRVPADELSLESSLQDLHSIVNFYSPDRKVILIGHSWGGMLASGYIGLYPEKVNKAILGEPGMLTSETANIFMERTNGMMPEMSLRLLWNIGKIWFKSLHLNGPDNQAKGDFLFENIAMLNDPDNPMLGYFCNRDMSNTNYPYWRMGFTSSMSISRKAMNEGGDMQINLVEGVDQFNGGVLFLTGECNTIIGEDIQKLHMTYFNYAQLKIIKDAGHNMITEQPEICINLIRDFLQRPTSL